MYNIIYNYILANILTIIIPCHKKTVFLKQKILFTLGISLFPMSLL